MVLSGVVLSGVVLSGVVWCSVVLSGALWCGVVLHGHYTWCATWRIGAGGVWYNSGFLKFIADLPCDQVWDSWSMYFSLVHSRSKSAWTDLC